MYLEQKIGKENQLIAQFQKHRYMQSLSLQKTKLVIRYNRKNLHKITYIKIKPVAVLTFENREANKNASEICKFI
jgi:hypothetical protein